MADIRVKLTEQELIQIIGEYVRKTYNVDRTTVHWSGNSPTGVEIFCSTDTDKKIFKNLFEE